MGASTPSDGCSQLICMTCRSRSQSDWCVLGDDEIALIDKVKLVRACRKGDLLYSQGDSCHSIFCVVSGMVALRKSDAEGNSILLRLVHAGQTLGYRDMFADQMYTNTAEVLRPSTVCQIPEPAVRKLLEHNPKLGFQFLNHCAADQESTEESLLHQITLPVRSRLIHLLLTLKDRYGDRADDGSLVVSLPMTRQDIAALLGTRPETIARTINELVSDEVMNFAGRIVSIPNLDVLLDEIENPGL